MRIAYLTTDDVNRAFAIRLARATEADLCPLRPEDPTPGGPFDVLLYDLDYLPPHQRHQLVAGLLPAPAAELVAVHSYNLRRSETRSLRRNGVAVFRRLRPAVFVRLRRQAEARLRGSAGAG